MLTACAASAEIIRFATYDTGLGRKGPGVMLRDLRAARNEQSEAALAVIAAGQADVILLMDVDWDQGSLGLDALAERLADLGQSYPYRLSLRPNSGIPSGVDLDGDGTTHEARDALGYGWFTGDSGLVVLSRYPLGRTRDLSDMRWSDRSEAAQLLPPEARQIVPLATTAQWVVPVMLGATEITLITLSAGTPVFDGPEDRNGLRNRDELALVSELARDADLPLVMGRANQDPERGEGVREALSDLLNLTALQDARPTAPDGSSATVRWDGPGEMRVDYVLPPRALSVVGAGVLWPEPGDPLRAITETAGPARLVWVDVAVP